MAEWLVEAGIGETRAVLVEDDRILEARILPDGEIIAGTVLDARLVARLPERDQGIAAWAAGEALVTPLPRGVTQGAMCRIAITRPALSEPGKPKRARARPAPDAPVGVPDAVQDLTGARPLSLHGPDRLSAAGWEQLLEEAATGQVDFPGGSLAIFATPAMTLIDIDGVLAADRLAVAGAAAAARAIRRLDIAGSIGIDLPTVADKAARQAAAQAIDDHLPLPFERTAVNGFGFVQIVRRRTRRSLVELAADDPAAFHARALLRRAERTPGTGPRTLSAHPAVLAAIEAIPDWRPRLEAALGVPVGLRAEPALAISAGHVQALHP